MFIMILAAEAQEQVLAGDPAGSIPELMVLGCSEDAKGGSISLLDSAGGTKAGIIIASRSTTAHCGRGFEDLKQGLGGDGAYGNRGDGLSLIVNPAMFSSRGRYPASLCSSTSACDVFCSRLDVSSSTGGFSEYAIPADRSSRRKRLFSSSTFRAAAWISREAVTPSRSKFCSFDSSSCKYSFCLARDRR